MSKEHTLNGKEVSSYAATHPASLPALSLPVPISLPSVLSSSEHTLLFDQTDARKPSFRLVAVSQQPVGLPLTLTTDAPAYFQLATDDSPRFSPQLTLTPSINPTYVHIRYATAETGPHIGQLTVTNGHHTIGVVLTGQRRRRSLPGFSRPPVSQRPVERAVRTSRQGLLLVSLSLLAAVAYFIFSGKLILSGQTADSAAVPPGAPVQEMSPVPVSPAKTGAYPAKEQRTVTNIRRPKARTTAAASQKKASILPGRQPEPPGQERVPERGAAETRRDVVKSAAPTYARSSEPVKEKPSSPASLTAESELERALNQPH